MPKKYTIKSGDCLSSLGERYRIPWKKIWQDSANEPLRKKRGDPDVLYPGDIIYIPDFEKKMEFGATEQRHRFRLKLNPIWIRVAVLDILHQPMADVPYHFVVDGEPQPEAQTTSEGLAEVKIHKAESEVVLHLPWGELPVELGRLDPANTIKGIQERLKNLGIDPGLIDGRMGPRTAAAIRQFQELELKGKKATGVPDEDTVKRLREFHEKVVLDGEVNRVEENPDEAAEPMRKDEIEEETAEETVDFDDEMYHIGSSEDDIQEDIELSGTPGEEPAEEEEQE